MTPSNLHQINHKDKEVQGYRIWPMTERAKVSDRPDRLRFV